MIFCDKTRMEWLRPFLGITRICGGLLDVTCHFSTLAGIGGYMLSRQKGELRIRATRGGKKGNDCILIV